MPDREDPLGKPKRIIIMTELPARRKMAGQTLEGKTWTGSTVWRITLLTSHFQSEVYCHNLEEAIRNVSMILKGKRIYWTRRDRLGKMILESVVHRVRSFVGR